jgi:hypothetical protein
VVCSVDIRGLKMANGDELEASKNSGMMDKEVVTLVLPGGTECV